MKIEIKKAARATLLVVNALRFSCKLLGQLDSNDVFSIEKNVKASIFIQSISTRE